MTAKQLVESPTVRLAVYVFVMGMAYATLKLEVETVKAGQAVNSGKIEMLRESLYRIEADGKATFREVHQQHEFMCLTRKEQFGCQP